MDGFTIRALTRELDAALARGRINKVYQPTDRDLVLHTYTPQGSLRLIASAHPNRPRLHITGLERANPQVPTSFVMLLRRRLEGARILGVEQPGWERILRLDCGVMDELGNPAELVLVVEAMGKHSNVILLESGVAEAGSGTDAGVGERAAGRIVDSLKRVSHAVNRYREVLPGRAYIPPPPQDKLDPLLDLAELAAELGKRTGTQERLVADALVRTVDGLGPELAAEAVFLAGIPETLTARDLAPKAWHGLAHTIQEMAQRVDSGAVQATRYVLKRGKQLVSPFPLRHLEEGGFRGEPCLDLSASLDLVYGSQEEADRIEAVRQSLRTHAGRELDRVQRKLALQEESLRHAADAEDLRVHGELLASNLHLVKPGQSEITVVNFYDSEGAELTIPLDPHRTPAENLQSHFRRYTRSRNTLKGAGEQAERSRAEAGYLDQVLATIEQADTLQQLGEIQRELVGEGYMEETAPRHRGRGAGGTPGKGGKIGRAAGKGGRGGKPGSGSKKAGGAAGQGRGGAGGQGGGAAGGGGRQAPSSPAQFRTSTGHLVLVGRNNRQNDWLTLRHAGDDDLWFHTKEIPGSHVILKDPGEDPPEEAIREAAVLAAYFSKGRQSGQVPVDYTRRRHVRKPSGAKPGMVIYDHQRTLYVTPDEEAVDRLTHGTPQEV